jgi:Domain of unknown function (DUF1835)
MTDSSATYRHFRLNLEQQRKRAKELLAAARSGDSDALERIRASAALDPTVALKLADAQRAIAREQRFETWAELKRHVEAMTRAREAIGSGAVEPLDGDRRTLHVRCGSDIREALLQAGFEGDFYEHSYPYLIGPVREGAGCLEQRARFIVDAYGSDERSQSYEAVLDDLRRAEQQLERSADYERVVIWSERDCYDQLVLVRLLGHYAAHRRPPRLELVNLAEFPGAVRFLGLGQLPPEALRMLWPTRAEARGPQVELGRDAWHALARPDPRKLAAIARAGTRALPMLAPALHRHLRELPSVTHGLSFTEEMALGVLANEDTSLNAMFGTLTYRIDPLPGQGDSQLRDRVLAMEQATAPLIARRPGTDRLGRARPPWTDVLSITETGRAVLGGAVDYLSLAPPSRWVGGVEIGAGRPDWRWDEATRQVVLRAP